jgi:hypothetical protein
MSTGLITLVTALVAAGAVAAVGMTLAASGIRRAVDTSTEVAHSMRGHTVSAAGKRRRISWAAGITALAGLLSASAAMITAGTGVWRPPVPIPVLNVKVAWVAPSPPPVAQAQPTASSTPTPVPAPMPTPTKDTSAGFRADWSNGMDGWAGVAQWKTIPGLLISDGTSHLQTGWASRGADSVQPPQQLSGANYAVESRIQIVDPTSNGCYVDLQIRAEAEGRGADRHGYALGFQQGTGAFAGRFSPDLNWTTIKQTSFSPGSDWHTYRAEVQQNQLTLKIDGSIVLQAVDNTYLNPGQVGLGNGNCQVQVSSFVVAPL